MLQGTCTAKTKIFHEVTGMRKNDYHDPFGVAAELTGTKQRYFSLPELGLRTGADLNHMPLSLKILLESVLRNIDGRLVTGQDVHSLLSWEKASSQVPFMPARVLMQDFTGVPAVVDLAAMRDALADKGGDPALINPLIPVDLVIDHSVQVDCFASQQAVQRNAELEFERNRERYEFLRWGGESFERFKVVPPATGICHQVNLEYLAQVVRSEHAGSSEYAYPDTLLGTDSHTPMIDGIGVLGWGVGGIEAEAVILGQPYYMLIPEVIGFRISGSLPAGATPTDIVLRITERLREYGVVGKLVEFFGPGVGAMEAADRALVSNMSPETGATALYFPVDERTLRYLEQTGRPRELVKRVEAYTRAQGLFRDDSMVQPRYADVLELDLGDVRPSISGPKRPHDRIPLDRAKQDFERILKEAGDSPAEAKLKLNGEEHTVSHGAVVIAALTSCTNTSDPTVMIGAGILARNAAQRGLKVPAHVKTSLAPGSRVVTRYLQDAGLLQYLETLGFHLVGYGCTTCIGNSGPLIPEVSRAISDNNLLAASVLSGNRNFEGRIHQEVRANYLMSPPLVVAYALAGSMKVDLTSEPLGTGTDGQPVFLSDIWPSEQEVSETVGKVLSKDLYTGEYENVYIGNETWNKVQVSGWDRYPWSDESTYIRKPPFFEQEQGEQAQTRPIESARVLALLGDTVTTDHISPAGSIQPGSPAGRWLIEHGVKPDEFNSYGSRRGNHEVMIRGTFANIRIRNRLVPGKEGGFTLLLPEKETMTIYEAAEKYGERGVPLLVIAGREYGSGSSRDWAAKGTALLGVRAVIASSYERIHRSNLIGMGVLPLQFMEGQDASSLGLDGTEVYSLLQPAGPAEKVEVQARTAEGDTRSFQVLARLDTDVEFEYYSNGGILQTVLEQMV
jgi:aconitate hydratase